MHFNVVCQLLLIIYHFLKFCQAWAIQCPLLPHWNLRANEVCNHTDGYFCIYDENSRLYNELCRLHPEYETSGYRMVMQGNIQGKPCKKTRYQPFTFWSNGNTHCTYTKSTCNEDGQILFHAGTYEADAACSCDYSMGFSFVSRPAHLCYCIPSQEDCSCYKKDCSVGLVLTPDYKCLAESAWNVTFICPHMMEKTLLPHPPSSNNLPFTTAVKVSVVSRGILLVAVTSLITCGIIIIGVVFSTVWYMNAHNVAYHLKKFTTDEVNKSDVEVVLKETDDVETQFAGKEIEKEKVKLANFIVTKATDKILTTIKTKQCLLITGSIGCGKSVNAYYAAFELEKEGFQVIAATPSELLKFCKINTKQLLILDDVIGKYTVEKYNVQWLKQNGAALTSLLNINANTKIIMTCRSHLYNKCILQCGYIAYAHCDLLSNDLQLTLTERKQICEKYLEKMIADEITNEVIMLYDFWPSLCEIFIKEKRTVEFFKHPFDYLTNEINQFKTREEFEYLALALLVILNNNVEMAVCNLSCQQHEELLQNVYLDSSFRQLPAKGLLFNTFTSLVGTFVKDKSSSFSFMNEALFETVLVCVGKSFANCILKYSSCTFIKDRLQLHFNEAPDDNLRIILDPCFKDSFFFRLLSDIKAGYITIVFANFQLQFKCFWTILLDYLTKDQKARLSVDTADGSTIIHVISTNGYADMLEKFLKVDSALINQTDNRKNTALHIACSNEQQNIVVLLLKNNAGANTKGENMKTPLHLAAINGNTTIAGYLLKCNAVLNQKDKDGLTPLHLACIKDRSSMVQYLLDHNAKVNSIDAVSRTPLYIACEKNSLKIVQTLLKHKVDINKVSKDGNGPLHVACENGYCNVVSALCEQNANVEQYTTHGDTPLILACQAGHQSVVEILLNYEAKTNKNSKSGSTPLYESCAIGHANIVKTLLARGADVNQISGNGHFTALAISCSMGNAKIVELLLQKGADIDKPDKNGRTPLCMAALGGNLEVVKILISYKAAVNKADCNGQTPLLFACTVGRIDIVKELLKHGNLDIVNNARTTPLHIACTKGSVDIVNILAQNNAKINAQDENGKTPLLNACLKDHMQIAEMLIERGASANICDNKGISPLSIASQKGLTALIKLLKHSTEQ